jgi:hypothetical protein
MNTFVTPGIQSVLDKVSVWEMDKAVSSTHRTNKRGEHLFFARTKLTTRYVVWSKVGNKVQRREYQRNRKTRTTTLFVDYFQCNPLPTYDELVGDHAPAYV